MTKCTVMCDMRRLGLATGAADQQGSREGFKFYIAGSWAVREGEVEAV